MTGDFQLLPIDTGLELDDELAALVDPTDLVEVGDEQIPLGQTWLFDFESSPPQFVLHGSEPVPVRGLDAVKMALQVALRLQRFVNPIVPDHVGMEDPDSIPGRVDDVERRIEYQSDIRETLLTAYERVTDVRDFDIVISEGDEFNVLLQTCSVVMDDGQLIQLEGIVLS